MCSRVVYTMFTFLWYIIYRREREIMTYVIADIHGCYKEYRELLEKVGFSDTDTLYVLGDALDRGPEPMAVILDMMDRPNVYYILGNHDLLMMTLMKKLAQV